MRSGRLNQIIEIQRFTVAEDGLGQEIKTWTTIHKVWAGIEPTGTSEAFAEDQLNSQIDVQVIIRHISDLDMKDRIKHIDRDTRERFYEIVGDKPNQKLNAFHQKALHCRLLHDEATTGL